MEQKDLLGMTIEELKQFAVELGEAPFRGNPIVSMDPQRGT